MSDITMHVFDGNLYIVDTSALRKSMEGMITIGLASSPPGPKFDALSILFGRDYGKPALMDHRMLLRAVDCGPDEPTWELVFMFPLGKKWFTRKTPKNRAKQAKTLDRTRIFHYNFILSPE